MSVHRVNTEGSDTIPLIILTENQKVSSFQVTNSEPDNHQIRHKDVNTEQQNDATLHVWIHVPVDLEFHIHQVLFIFYLAMKQEYITHKHVHAQNVV